MTRRAYLYFGATIVLGAILGGVGVYYFFWHTGRIQHPGGFNKGRAVAHGVYTHREQVVAVREARDA